MSSWGDSFGSSWGNAWGISGPTPPAPTPGRDGLGGDDVPRGPNKGWSLEEWKRLRKAPDDALENELRSVYAELTSDEAPISVLAQVDAIVRPFASEKADRLEIDWQALSSKYEDTARLVRLAREEQELRFAMEEEEAVMLLMIR